MYTHFHSGWNNIDLVLLRLETATAEVGCTKHVFSQITRSLILHILKSEYLVVCVRYFYISQNKCSAEDTAR